MQSKVLIIDFGSQYTQLIARRIREIGVYSEVVPYTSFEQQLDTATAIIISGSPFSVRDQKAPKIDVEHLAEYAPVLGICYGAQLMAHHMGGRVEASAKREYGRAHIHSESNDPFLKGIQDNRQVWMSHGDHIEELPEHCEIIAHTDSIPVAAFKIKKEGNPMYGIQFHPEVAHTPCGKDILSNFVVDIAGSKKDWSPASFIDMAVENIAEQVGDGKVLLGLSGGVDSTVAASLIQKAIGEHLHSFFIDNGLLRKNEFDQVLAAYKAMGLHVTGIDARDEFLDALSGVSDPEAKRKIIGKVFIDVFVREAKKIKGIEYLGQGTIYPDVIESVSVHGPSVTIKSHHNVGGLPEKLDLSLVEPLRMLFKDEVRKVGKELGIPDAILSRHPFPGPGLAIRILGAISREKVKLLQEADHIYIETLRKHNLYDKIWQAGAILLPVRSVGVMGDERSYEFALALRAVNSSDGMTAEWSKIPHDVLAEISNRIINNVKGVNRVAYDISTKPPATIEWE